jgi:hypothetical protein
VDLKSFVVGAICGALVYAAAAALLEFGQNPPESQESALEAEAESGQQPSSTFAASSDPGLSISDALVSSDGAENASIADTFSDISSTSDVRDSSREGPSTPITSDLFDPTEAARGWYSRQMSELLQEQKDESWAYYTEQAIQQFLANHPEFPKFSVDYLECRTTVCQIAVAGFDESTGPTWQAILFDMRSYNWYEFGQVGTSSSSVDGRYILITRLHRVFSDVE